MNLSYIFPFKPHGSFFSTNNAFLLWYIFSILIWIVFSKKMKHKNLYIVGAGLFGCTIALVLSKAGYFVDLYEKNPDIMSETSLKTNKDFT